jgi:MarR family transcriptional regulator for hemolysin
MESSFAFELADTAQVLRRAFDRRASALGTTRAQWRVLARLARKDGQRQVELADSLDVEPITLCRMIDRLCDSGLVERRADKEDRRARRVHLTEKAKPIIESLREIADDFFAEALSGVGENEQEQIRGALHRIRANVAAATSRNASVDRGRK